ncbi:MAG: nitrate ABC transporter ATP-binding protein [Deltaproteobacteria bacterium]|nr:MAG: nitrate ABC transporter ATP-binding protein [Desulfobacterales bacterium]PIE73766.1 MAG: nitrate ABC transporter ATP-binding protein [Deltaproteobacteria bacterium]
MSLTCNNLGFAYPGALQPLLSDVSFHLLQPGLHSFFGPSGVGKTTLAKIISGDIIGHTGSVKIDGLSSVLYCHNKERLPGWSSVDLHLRKIISAERHVQLDELIEIFGLSDCAGTRFGQLSMGQQNRVNLIRYLLQDCDLLIMDESLANVDELTRGRIILAIKAMFPKRFFIYISHNVMEVGRYCDRILVFRSSDKRPQTLMVEGCDDRGSDKEFSRSALDTTLLEIMNAS